MSKFKDPKNQAKLNHFILEHMPLVNLHIKKLRNSGKIPEHIEDEDLHFEGIHGLIDALHRFDDKMGVKFSTYAGRRIAGKMLDHASSQDVIPKHIRAEAKKFKASAQPTEAPIDAPTSAPIKTPKEPKE